jgi:hypothetical protein
VVPNAPLEIRGQYVGLPEVKVTGSPTATLLGWAVMARGAGAAQACSECQGSECQGSECQGSECQGSQCQKRPHEH